MLTFDYDRLGLRARDIVLDVGCGGGRHTFEALRRGSHAIAVDLDGAALKDVAAMAGAMTATGSTPTNAAFVAVKGDVVGLPFRDGVFDRAIASEVLEHIADDASAMREIARVVKPGGRVVVSVPRFWPEKVCWMLSREYRTKPGGHLRIYRVRELSNALRRAGFIVLAKHHAHGLHPPYWWLRCICGIDDERALLPRLYHRFLVWDLMNKPRVTRVVERLLDPIMGKSVVIYCERTPRHVA